MQLSSFQTSMRRRVPVILLAIGFMALIGVSLGRTVSKAAIPGKPGKQSRAARFAMVRSAAAQNGACLLNASATVTIRPLGPVELMSVDAFGLPPNTEFDFFVLQLPNAPFGLAWYQGDVETDGNGEAHQEFIGRFNIETFIVAQPPGGQPAPFVHDHPFPDATSNPATEPVHTYHLGLWFNSPNDAVAAGCPGTVTRFNGEHNAGIQVLSTRNFPDLEGPLRQVSN